MKGLKREDLIFLIEEVYDDHELFLLDTISTLFEIYGDEWCYSLSKGEITRCKESEAMKAVRGHYSSYYERKTN